MKVTGIIAEYNPLHKGHLYHLNHARELTNADYIIVAMSGNFTQRGTPALMDKYLRTEMALANGADLVLELPSQFACSSAEFFADASISLFNQLGIVDSICFGSECGSMKHLLPIAEILANEPEEYIIALKKELRSGYSYPHARARALEHTLPACAAYSDILGFPNNILGIEYTKAIIRQKSSITPYTNKRMGSNYHDLRLSQSYSSAISIRHSLASKGSLSLVKEQLPDSCFTIMQKHYKRIYPIFLNDFSSLLKYRLILEEKNSFTQFADISPDLSDKIKKNIYHMETFDDFCNLLKSKNITYARINRCLSHILLDIKQADLDWFKKNGSCSYGRILGFQTKATPLLRALKEHASIPFISQASEAKKLLADCALKQFEKDIEVSHIYESVVSSKFNRKMQNEYTRQVIKI